ncbi:GNAT family N-acetyltransferase [Thalassotalea piscium]
MPITESIDQSTIIYREMTPEDFNAIVILGTQVHGEGYIDNTIIKGWYQKGIHHNINASFVAYAKDKLVGFRLTFSAQHWDIDSWCTPELWQIPSEQVCYFKCNTVDENYRGYGIGSQLLNLSISAAKQQGALAGVSHLWRQSPGNSAVIYFSKCGGKLIKNHPDRWNELSQQGYQCPVCDLYCHCEAAEMMILF